jgi:peptide/nickel transport system ATP-binding protein
MTEQLLTVEDLRVRVDGSGGRSREVVRGVSFGLNASEALGLVGESGSGKTLTVSAIARLLPRGTRVAGGAVSFRGVDLLRLSPRKLAEIRGRDISIVVQDSLSCLNPLMRIGRQVAEPLLLHHMADRRQATELAVEGLRRLGIPDAALAMRRHPHEFSGGMRQRAMIATALIASPSLVIADEPTTALDATVQAQIIDIWTRLNKEMGVALILVSHDLAVVNEVCDTLAVMYAGRIVEMGPAQLLIERPQHPYTQALLESMPSASTRRQDRLKAIPGEPPSFEAIPAGCPFHPRCRYAQDICRSEEPQLLDVQGAKVACWVAQQATVALWPVGVPASTGAAPTAVETRPTRAATAADAEEILALDRVTRHHLLPSLWPFMPPTEVHALDDVSLSLRRGETLGIAGESGCGKSTLAKCVLRLIDVDRGRILFRGQDITRTKGEELRQLRRYIQPVFQDPYDSLNPRARVKDIVAEPLVAHGVGASETARRVSEVLELVGLGGDLAGTLPHQLSGGQRQRAGIARAIALNPELIVADEPISALDVSIQAQVLNLFRDLQRQFALTLIFISHDLRVVRYVSTNIAVMFLGQIVEYGPGDLICRRPAHPYTQALLSSVPDMAERSSDRRIILRGEPPSPSAPPSGCRFRTRCPRAQALCAKTMPGLRRLPDGRQVACHFPIQASAGTETAR